MWNVARCYVCFYAKASTTDRFGVAEKYFSKNVLQISTWLSLSFVTIGTKSNSGVLSGAWVLGTSREKNNIKKLGQPCGVYCNQSDRLVQNNCQLKRILFFFYTRLQFALLYYMYIYTYISRITRRTGHKTHVFSRNVFFSLLSLFSPSRIFGTSVSAKCPRGRPVQQGGRDDFSC